MCDKLSDMPKKRPQKRPKMMTPEEKQLVRELEKAHQAILKFITRFNRKNRLLKPLALLQQDPNLVHDDRFMVLLYKQVYLHRLRIEYLDNVIFRTEEALTNHYPGASPAPIRVPQSPGTLPSATPAPGIPHRSGTRRFPFKSTLLPFSPTLKQKVKPTNPYRNYKNTTSS